MNKDLEMFDPSQVTPLCNRHLAFVKIDDWTGLMDVFYNPHTGWRACHTEEPLNIAVLWYMAIPTINGESLYSSVLTENFDI